MMKIAVSSYSFSQALRTGRMNLYDCIVKAKELGFEAIEIVDFNMVATKPEDLTMEEYAVKIREKADEVGLKITNFTCIADFQAKDLQEEIDRVKSCIDIAVILGAEGLRHDVAHGLSPEGTYQNFDSILPRLVEGVRAVADYGQEKGIKTMSENHGFFAQDVLRVERLMNAVNHPNYGWLVDMGNFICANEDPAKSVGIAAPYAVYVHAKDFLIKPADGQHPGRLFRRSRNGGFFVGTIIGHGNVPVKHCLAALRNAGYDGYIAIEFEGVEDCLLAIEVGKENLERYLQEIEEIPLKKNSF